MWMKPLDGNLGKAIFGYGHEVVPGVVASYNYANDDDAHCAIRIKMSQMEFMSVQKEVKDRLLLANQFRSLGVRTTEFSYDKRGFGEMEYHSYLLKLNGKVVGTLKAIAKGVKAEYDWTVFNSGI